MILRLDNHIKQNDLGCTYQSAYKRGFSCETALLKLTNDLLWSMEHKELNALVVVDLSTAFLQKKYGITGKALMWYQNFLKDRQLKVVVNAKYSQTKNI